MTLVNSNAKIDETDFSEPLPSWASVDEDIINSSLTGQDDVDINPVKSYSADDRTYGSIPDTGSNCE